MSKNKLLERDIDFLDDLHKTLEHLERSIDETPEWLRGTSEYAAKLKFRDQTQEAYDEMYYKIYHRPHKQDPEAGGAEGK